MKKIIIFIILFIITFSCKKEPNIISQVTLAKLYIYYYGSGYHMDNYSATYNNNKLIIKGQNEYFSINIISDNIDIGITKLDTVDSNHWACFTKADRNTYFSEDNNSGNNYIKITENDKVNKTISGKFELPFLNGSFNKLPYTNTKDSIIPYATFKYGFENMHTNYINILKNSGYDMVNYTIYYSDYEVLVISDILENGTYNLKNKPWKFYIQATFDLYSKRYYSKPIGTYTVSDSVINNHTYKKITIDGHFSSKTVYFDENAYLSIKNTEILIY